MTGNSNVIINTEFTQSRHSTDNAEDINTHGTSFEKGNSIISFPYQIQMYKQRKYLLKQLISIPNNFMRYLSTSSDSTAYKYVSLRQCFGQKRSHCRHSIYQLMSHNLEQLVRLVRQCSLSFLKKPVERVELYHPIM